jgi:acyl-coenzyme A synthetase/AMP-(fatty) acid ligase
VDLTPESILNDPLALLDHLESARITSLFTVPTVAVQLLEADPRAVTRLSSLRRLLLTGELISQKLGRLMVPLIQSGVRVHNEYGATEFPYGLSRILSLQDTKQPNILDTPVSGRAADFLLTPMGEVEITGPGVMSGYVDQTTDFEAPFRPLESYRSGDVAEWLPTGRLRLIGRHDRQVRHLGHRVELAEIEAALEEYPGIELASVRYDPERLEFTAHVSLPAGARQSRVEGEAFGTFLRRRLPDYMVPHHIRAIRMMPRTATGKKNYLALNEAEPVL